MAPQLPHLMMHVFLDHEELLATLKFNLQRAQERMRIQAYHHHRDKEFNVDDLVLLSYTHNDIARLHRVMAISWLSATWVPIKLLLVSGMLRTNYRYLVPLGFT